MKVMENHKNVLFRLCRLCKGTVRLTRGYRNIKYVVEKRTEIQLLFDYDINNDTDDLHPKSLCANCVSQLLRVNNADQYETAPLAIFCDHDDNDCNICNHHKRLKHTFSVKRKMSISLAGLDEIASSKGLTRLVFDSNMRIYIRPCISTCGIQVEISIKVHPDFTWTVSVFDNVIKIDESKFFAEFPEKLTLQTATELMVKISSATLCCGNDDFPLTIAKRKEDHQQGNTKTVLQNKQFLPYAEIKGTIRSKDCELLIAQSDLELCTECSNNTKALKFTEKRLESYDSAVNCKRPHSTMTKKQLRKRLFIVAKENKELKRKIRALEKRIDGIVERDGVNLDDSTEECFPLTQVETKKKSASSMFNKGNEEPHAKKPKESGVDLTFGNLTRDQVTEVGIVNPLEDFKTLMEMATGRNTENEVLAQMSNVVMKLLKESFLDQYYPKAMECMKALREQCIKLKRAKAFNDLLLQLKEETYGKRRQDFWERLTDGTFNPINKDYADDSKYSDAESRSFFAVPDEKKDVAIEQSNIEDDSDDLLDML